MEAGCSPWPGLECSQKERRRWKAERGTGVLLARSAQAAGQEGAQGCVREPRSCAEGAAGEDRVGSRRDGVSRQVHRTCGRKDVACRV